jgi:hypothetical protein
LRAEIFRQNGQTLPLNFANFIDQLASVYSRSTTPKKLTVSLLEVSRLSGDSRDRNRNGAMSFMHEDRESFMIGAASLNFAQESDDVRTVRDDFDGQTK